MLAGRLLDVRRFVLSPTDTAEPMPEPRSPDPRSLSDRTLAGLCLESLSGRVVWANPAFARMLGLPGPAALEGTLTEALFVDPGEAQRRRERVLSTGSSCDEILLKTATGDAIWVLALTVSTGDPITGQLEILSTLIDVSRQKLERERLEKDAYHDALTGLPNRRLLRIRAEQALAMAKRRRERAALLYLDLIGFKGVNDHLGHGAGDTLLEQVGRRLEGALRTADIAARQGGDEFVVLLADVDGIPGASVAAARLGGHLSKTPYLLKERSVNLDARFGVAVFPDHAETLDGLIEKADHALSEAKRAGGPVIRLARA